MSNVLRNLTVTYGSLVDEPANKSARILLFKRDYSTDQRNQMAEAGTAMPDGSFPIANTADLKNAIQSIGRAKDRAAAMAHIKQRAKALGATDMLPPDWMGKRDDNAVVSALIDAAADIEKVGRKISASRQSRLQAVMDQLKSIMSENDPAEEANPADGQDPMKEPCMSTKRDDSAAAPTVETLTAKVAELEKALGDRDAKIVELEKAAKPAPTEDDILKSLPAGVRERIEKAEAAAKAAGDVAKAERDARLTNEYIAKAAKFGSLSQDATKLGPILKRAFGGEPLTADDCTELERILTAANEAVSKSALFGELGTSAADETNSATERLNKMALDRVVEKKSANYAEAFSAVTSDPANRELAAAYLAEQRARN